MQRNWTCISVCSLDWHFLSHTATVSETVLATEKRGGMMLQYLKFA